MLGSEQSNWQVPATKTPPRQTSLLLPILCGPQVLRHPVPSCAHAAPLVSVVHSGYPDTPPLDPEPAPALPAPPPYAPPEDEAPPAPGGGGGGGGGGGCGGG